MVNVKNGCNGATHMTWTKIYSPQIKNLFPWYIN